MKSFQDFLNESDSEELGFLSVVVVFKNDTPLKTNLGGGFKHFLFLPLLGEMIQFDVHIFQMGGSTTN